MELQVQKYMTRNPVSIAPDDTLSTARVRMEECGIRHLPVIDGTRLVGVISSRDLFLLDALKERLLYLIKVRDLMMKEPYTIAPQTPLSEVAAHMAERKIGSAVVVEGTRVIGVFTAIDALRALADVSKAAARS